jgi:HIRAN domain
VTAAHSAQLHLIGIVGEAMMNADGQSRQIELQRCSSGEQITVVREPENPHDNKAVRIDSIRGVTIGYISKQDRWLADLMDKGVPVRGIINDVTGGTRDKPSLGCVIRIRTGGKELDRPIPRVTSRPRSSSDEIQPGHASPSKKRASSSWLAKLFKSLRR